MNYGLDDFSVLFLPKIDPLNDYKTIIFNFSEQKILKINKSGYFILKAISDSPGISLENIYDLAALNRIKKPEVKIFMDEMIKEKIIYVP